MWAPRLAGLRSHAALQVPATVSAGKWEWGRVDFLTLDVRPIVCHWLEDNIGKGRDATGRHVELKYMSNGLSTNDIFVTRTRIKTNIIYRTKITMDGIYD